MEFDAGTDGEDKRCGRGGACRSRLQTKGKSNIIRQQKNDRSIVGEGLVSRVTWVTVVQGHR